MLCLDLFHLLEQSPEYETTVEFLPLALLSQGRGIKAEPQPNIHRSCNSYEFGGLSLTLFCGVEYSQVLRSEKVGRGPSASVLHHSHIQSTLRAVSDGKKSLCFHVAWGSEKCARLIDCLKYFIVRSGANHLTII